LQCTIKTIMDNSIISDTANQKAHWYYDMTVKWLCVISLTSTTDECRVVDVETLTFHRCRAARPTGQYFTMNNCSAGEAINIQSAELGYSISYNPNTRPPRCHWLDCTVSTDEPARLCNGRRSCNISQTILIYPPGTALCHLQKDGNFIRIIFTCIAGMTSPLFLYANAMYRAQM